MKTLEQANKVAEELRAYIMSSVKDTETEVTVSKIADETFDIEVKPGPNNRTAVLFCMDKVTYFCRYHNLSVWVGAEISGGYAYPYFHIH